MLGGRSILLVISLLIAGGCSSESSSGSTGSTTTAAVVAGADTTAESVETTNPAAETTAAPSDTTLDMSDLSVCAATKWLVLADQVDNVFDGTPLASMEGFSFVVEGEGLIDLRADGTYTYTPAFSAVITVAGQSGSGEWSGTLDGTWQIDGDQLTMAQTTNALTGTMTIFGQTQPLPAIGAFQGSGTVVECTPVTLKYELTTPVGLVTQTLVVAE